MRLYHGSNTRIDSINLAMCRPYKDFGTGFYLTDIREQAERMAVRVATIYGGTPILNIFDIQDDFRTLPDLQIKDFGDRTTEEWARFVMNNRNSSFVDKSDKLCNQDNKYDIVIGPVADDVFEKLQNHETGLYRESSAYVYDLFRDEMNFGHIVQAEI